MLISNLGALGLDKKKTPAKAPVRPPAPVQPPNLISQAIADAFRPTQPLLANKGTGEKDLNFENENGEIRRGSPKGPKVYKFTASLANGMDIDFESDRDLTDDEIQGVVNEYSKTPSYKKQLAIKQKERAAAAKVPTSQLGPMDNEAVARHYQDRYEQMMGPNGLAIAKQMTPAQIADLPIEVQKSLNQRAIKAKIATGELRPNGQPVDTGFDLSLQGLGDSFRRINEAISNAIEQGVIAGSQGVSRLIGQEPATTEFIKNAGPTRFAKGIASAGQYFIPGVGPVVGLAGAGQIATGLATDPQGTVKGLAEGLNVFDPKIDPIERGMRAINVLATIYGGYHAAQGIAKGVRVLDVSKQLGVSKTEALRIVNWAEEASAKAPKRTGINKAGRDDAKGTAASIALGNYEPPVAAGRGASNVPIPTTIQKPELKPVGGVARTQVGPSPMQTGPMTGATVPGRRNKLRAVPIEEPAVAKVDKNTQKVLDRSEVVQARNAAEEARARRAETGRPTLALPARTPEPPQPEALAKPSQPFPDQRYGLIPVEPPIQSKGRPIVARSEGVEPQFNPTPKTEGVTPKTGLDAAYEAAVASRKKGGTGNKNRQRGATENPAQVIADYAVIAAWHIRNGARTGREVLQKLLAEHPYDAELIKANLSQIIGDARAKLPEKPYRMKENGTIIGPERSKPTLGNPNEKAINEGVREVQSGQGIRNEGTRLQGQGNGQKANAFAQEKGQVTPESVGVKSAIEPTPATGGTRTKAAKAEPTPVAPTAGEPPSGAAISNKFFRDQTDADVPDADKQTVQQWIDAAFGAGHNTEAGTKSLVDAVLDGKKRDFTESEGMGIAARLTDLLTEKGTKGIEPARKTAIEAEIQRIAEATKKTGTNQARAFVARAMLVGHDYSPEGVYRSYELAGTGKGPDAGIRAQLDAAIQRNAELTKLLDAKEKGATVTKGDIALLDAVGKARASKTRLTNAQDRLDAIKAKRAGAASGMGSRERGAVNISIEDIKDLKELAGAYAQMGVARFQHFVDKVRGDFKEEFAHLSDDDIAEALNQKTGDARTLEEKLIQQNIARLKREAKYIDENAARPTKEAQALERVKKQIADTQARIDSGNVKGPKPSSEELKTARAQLAKLKRTEKYLVENASRPTKDTRYREQVQKQIDDYENQLKTGVYKDRSKPKMKASVELEALRNKRDAARLEIDGHLQAAKALAEYERMNIAQKAWVQAKDASGTPKALQAMADVSAVGNQTWELVKRAHVRTIGKGIVDMKQSFSKRGFGEVNARLKNDAAYSRARKAGVHFQGSGLMGEQGMTPHEKLIFTKLRGKIPGVSHVEGWSERTFNAYLNRARLETFKTMEATATRLNGGKPLTEAEAKVLGEYVNVLSGRGTGKLGESAELLYAPRFALSQVQTAVPGYQTAKAAFKGGGASTKTIARSEARGVAGQAAILATGTAAAAAFGGEVDMDKNSTNFGHLLLPIPNSKGAYWNLDLTGGRGSWITLGSRMVSGEKVRTHGPNAGGKKLDVFGFKVPIIMKQPAAISGKKSSGDVALDFARNKSTPVVGMVVDMVRGKTPLYTDFNFQDQARGMVAPLSAQAGIRSAYETNNPFIGAIVGMLNATGLRVDAQGGEGSYAQQKAEATKKRKQEQKLLGPVGKVVLPNK